MNPFLTPFFMLSYVFIQGLTIIHETFLLTRQKSDIQMGSVLPQNSYVGGYSLILMML